MHHTINEQKPTRAHTYHMVWESSDKASKKKGFFCQATRPPQHVSVICIKYFVKQIILWLDWDFGQMGLVNEYTEWKRQPQPAPHEEQQQQQQK